jgi:hypothetical protein
MGMAGNAVSAPNYRLRKLLRLFSIHLHPAPVPRNILFIFSDDHAQHAISAYGSKVNQTPHLDRIAKDGARFTNSFVTNSICTPSRATLLTGQYSHLNGVPVFNRFDGSRDHVAKHLQKGGYHTGMIGKWHLGSDPTGFDRWIVLPGRARIGIRSSSCPARSSPSKATAPTSPPISASSG